MTRVRLKDKYTYEAEKRDKYCVLSAVQRFQLAQAIQRKIADGVTGRIIKDNIHKQFKAMKGEKKELPRSTYYDLKNHEDIVKKGLKK